MIRKELCAIAGMTIPTFNSHRRNGNLPFVVDHTEGTDAAGRTWYNFTIHDAARMLAARHLCDAHGVTWAAAAEIIREPVTVCGPHGYGHQYFEKDGVFIAEVEFSNARTNEDPQLMPRRRRFKGPLDKIVSSAQAVAAAYTADRNRGVVKHDEIIVLTGIVAVDLSHNYKLAVNLAKQHGIDLQKADYSVDPDAAGYQVIGGQLVKKSKPEEGAR